LDTEAVNNKALNIVSKASREHKFRLAKEYIYEGGKRIGQNPILDHNHILGASWDIFKQRCLAHEADVSGVSITSTFILYFHNTF
jgi:hypothetical protein